MTDQILNFLSESTLPPQVEFYVKLLLLQIWPHLLLMAQVSHRLPQNVEGEFYVDSSCIDCDTCRQIAPGIFQDHGGQSSVCHQPLGERERLLASMALVACPTASIGSTNKLRPRAAVDAFPFHVADNVFFCGFTSESSFGAWSYLVTRPAEEGGNLLVDSPRFTSPLIRRIADMGGVDIIVPNSSR